MENGFRRGFGNRKPLRRLQPLLACVVVGVTILLITSCNEAKRPHASYVPISQLEPIYGRLITVSNSPTPNQNGTGDRLGLFRDDSGTVWGIPLTITENGETVGCAPAGLREARISDFLPADVTEILGAANEPTGWRGGTGKLELLVRNTQGTLRWQSVAAAEIESGPVCWSQSPPEQPLKYYRLAKATSVR
jgi:hypothetical protein